MSYFWAVSKLWVTKDIASSGSMFWLFDGAYLVFLKVPSSSCMMRISRGPGQNGFTTGYFFYCFLLTLVLLVLSSRQSEASVVSIGQQLLPIFDYLLILLIKCRTTSNLKDLQTTNSQSRLNNHNATRLHSSTILQMTHQSHRGMNPPKTNHQHLI